jgi:hypothetical protein
MLLRAPPTDRGILAATLALAAAATLALAFGYTGSARRLLSDAPSAIDGAQAVTAPAPVPAAARRKRDAPAPATTLTLDDQRGAVLYLLIEAGRPQPLFAR